MSSILNYVYMCYYLSMGGVINLLDMKNLNNFPLSTICMVNDKQLRGLFKIIQAFGGL